MKNNQEGKGFVQCPDSYPRPRASTLQAFRTGPRRLRHHPPTRRVPGKHLHFREGPSQVTRGGSCTVRALILGFHESSAHPITDQGSYAWSNPVLVGGCVRVGAIRDGRHKTGYVRGVARPRLQDLRELTKLGTGVGRRNRRTKCVSTRAPRLLAPIGSLSRRGGASDLCFLPRQLPRRNACDSTLGRTGPRRRA